MDDIAFQEIAPAERGAMLESITALWEESVRASHHFLMENDIARLKPSVERTVVSVETLVVGSADRPVGFMGIEARKLEMLFLHPNFFRRGIGMAFVRYAFERHGVNAVDCNEQNTGALVFYERMGFRTIGRTSVDSEGNPFPILAMRLPEESAKF